MSISVTLPSLHIIPFHLQWFKDGSLDWWLHHPLSRRAFASSDDSDAATEAAAINIFVECMKTQRTHDTTRTKRKLWKPCWSVWLMSVMANGRFYIHGSTHFSKWEHSQRVNNGYLHFFWLPKNTNVNHIEWQKRYSKSKRWIPCILPGNFFIIIVQLYFHIVMWMN